MGVVELKPFKAVANEQTLAILRDWLDMAERGEIVSVAIAAIGPDGKSFTAASQAEPLQTLLGAVTILQHRMLAGYLTPE